MDWVSNSFHFFALPSFIICSGGCGWPHGTASLLGCTQIWAIFNPNPPISRPPKPKMHLRLCALLRWSVLPCFSCALQCSSGCSSSSSCSCCSCHFCCSSSSCSSRSLTGVSHQAHVWGHVDPFGFWWALSLPLLEQWSRPCLAYIPRRGRDSPNHCLYLSSKVSFHLHASFLVLSLRCFGAPVPLVDIVSPS